MPVSPTPCKLQILRLGWSSEVLALTTCAADLPERTVAKSLASRSNAANVQGSWQWVNDAKPGAQQPKWGYASATPGDELLLRIQPGSDRKALARSRQEEPKQERDGRPGHADELARGRRRGRVVQRRLQLARQRRSI